MTFLEMESTQWYEIYKERIVQDEAHMKSDFQLLSSIFSKAVGGIGKSWTKLTSSPSDWHQPKPSLGGSPS